MLAENRTRVAWHIPPCIISLRTAVNQGLSASPRRNEGRTPFGISRLVNGLVKHLWLSLLRKAARNPRPSLVISRTARPSSKAVRLPPASVSSEGPLHSQLQAIYTEQYEAKLTSMIKRRRCRRSRSNQKKSSDRGSSGQFSGSFETSDVRFVEPFATQSSDSKSPRPPSFPGRQQQDPNNNPEHGHFNRLPTLLTEP